MNYWSFNFKYIFSIFLFSLGNLYAQDANIVLGEVIMPGAKKKLVGKIKEYGRSNEKPSHVNPNEMSLPDRNAFVILHPLSFEPELTPQRNAIISQKNQTFLPLVTAITKGTTVYILNEDNEYHNVFSRTRGSSFNIGRRPPGQTYPQQITKTGVIKLFCDIHEHMEAFILSLETPYFARVGADGQYRIAGLPEGKYMMEVYHPNIKETYQEIEVKGDKAHTFNINLDERS